MTDKITKTFFRKTVAEIAALDKTKVECQYQIANLLTAIRDHKMHELGGYDSFAMMVAGELEMHPSTANKYIGFFNTVTRLGYSKDETLKLMQRFGRNRIYGVLCNSEKKLSVRALAKRIHDGDQSRDKQFHFQIPEDRAAAIASNVLSQYGMVVTKSGQRTNMSTAFLKLVEEHERMKKQLAKASGKTKLASVA